MTAALTTKQFKANARAVHGKTYSYARAVYVNAFTKVLITCRKHGDFLQIPNAHVTQRSGCPECSKIAKGLSQRRDLEAFVKAAKLVHGNLYDYSKVSRLDSVRVPIICKKHGQWLQSVHSHLKGHCCPKCATRDRVAALIEGNASDFIKRAKRVHGDFYNYEGSVYLGTKKYVEIVCPKHGKFRQIAESHLAGFGCSVCTKNKYSSVAIRWIKAEAKRRRWKDVQHAESGGEYRLPGTRLFVDGFHSRSNTVLEFHGDRFHGNPKLYSPNSRPNPFSKLTAKQLYARTVKREEAIRALGYNLLVMWEQDYRNMQ